MFIIDIITDLVRITADAHDAWHTEIEWSQWKTGAIHKSNEKAAKTSIDM
jgi:hypothetical protein